MLDVDRSFNEERIFLFPITSSVILTLFLFFADEGYYDFKWMENPRNWLVFCCYLVGFFIGKALIARFCFKNTFGWPKKLLIIVLGVPLGFLISFALMYFAALAYTSISYFS